MCVKLFLRSQIKYSELVFPGRMLLTFSFNVRLLIQDKSDEDS